MGSNPLLRTYKATIVSDSGDKIMLKFQRKSSILTTTQSSLNEVLDEQEEKTRLTTDSLTSFNERGCDEIMCQFIQDLDVEAEVESDFNLSTHTIAKFDIIM